MNIWASTWILSQMRTKLRDCNPLQIKLFKGELRPRYFELGEQRFVVRDGHIAAASDARHQRR